MKHKHGGDIYRNPNIIDFSANLSPLGMPASVIEAAIQGVKHSNCYPDVECQALKEAIRKAEHVCEDHIICGNGAADLIFALCLAQKPKKALLPAPTFAEYEQALLTVDCDIQYFMLQEEKDFVLQEDFLEALTDEIDLVFLCNPNNPTGQMLPLPLLNAVLEVTKRKKIGLILDECFVEFIQDEVSVKEKLKSYPNLFLLKAFTKLYAMPGLRLGYGFCSDGDLLERMRAVMQPWNVSVVAQYAGVAAIQEKEYVRRTKEIVEEEKIFLLTKLKPFVDKIYGSAANFIFFRAREDFGALLLEKGILVRDCSNYPGLSKGYFRIAVRTREENKRLLAAVKELY